MRAVTLNDQLIAYRHRRSCGKTVVFANSLGTDQSIWEGVTTRLGGGLGVLTYDLRGHGLSATADKPFTVLDLASDLIALLEHEGLKDVLLCGVSVGGMIAQAVAAQRPDLIDGIILCNTAAKVGDTERWNERISRVQDSGLSSIADTILPNWFSESFQSRAPDLWQLSRNMLMRTSDRGYAAVCAAIRDSDLTDLTRRISVPTICVAGDKDQAVPIGDVKTMANHIEGARFVVLDDVGHIPCLEAPDAMANLITQFAQGNGTRLDRGMAVRRSVLGDAHVDGVEAQRSNFDTPFQKMISETAWGTVWASDAISRRERSMITVGLLAALGHYEELTMHLRAARRTGTSARDIQEVIQHVAIYAGLPRANHALKLAKQTLAEVDAEVDG